MLQEVSSDKTIGIKFNTFSGAPKTIMNALPTKDWTLKKVMQVEGERSKAVVSAKAIDTFFKNNLLLGSRVQVINTATPRWIRSSKGKRDLIEGMTTQIVLNDKLLCTDLDETNVFGKISYEVWEKNTNPFYYLLEHLMSMKSIRPVNVRGEMRYCPLFHSCCPRTEEETTFYYPPHCKEEAKNI